MANNKIPNLGELLSSLYTQEGRALAIAGLKLQQKGDVPDELFQAAKEIIDRNVIPLIASEGTQKEENSIARIIFFYLQAEDSVNDIVKNVSWIAPYNGIILSDEEIEFYVNGFRAWKGGYTNKAFECFIKGGWIDSAQGVAIGAFEKFIKTGATSEVYGFLKSAIVDFEMRGLFYKAAEISKMVDDKKRHKTYKILGEFVDSAVK